MNENTQLQTPKPSVTATEITETMFAVNKTLATDPQTTPEVLTSDVDIPVCDPSVGGDY